MTVPGVNVICAATFLAAVGDIRRFTDRAQAGRPTSALTRRSASPAQRPPRGGRISKQGSPPARWALVEAAWSVVRQPGPLHAFYQRIRARRGHQIAIVAAARKLACLFWCLLTRDEDYAHQQPSLTAKKLRRLEITAGAPSARKAAAGVWATSEPMRHAEKQLARQAEAVLQADRSATGRPPAPNEKAGASVTPERAKLGPQGESRAAGSKLQTPALRHVIARAHQQPNAA